MGNEAAGSRRRVLFSISPRGTNRRRAGDTAIELSIGTPSVGRPLPARNERGEGWGEGEETLRKPVRLRTEDEVGHSESRNAKLHARQSAKSLTVVGRRPPHPGPLPQGEGIRFPV